MTTDTTITPLTGHARAIVKSLLLDGPRSRTDLAASLDLSAGSLTRLTKPLLESELIVEFPNIDQPSGIGRPSVPLAFNHTKYRFIGVKLTRTHAYAALTLADARIERLTTRELPSASVQDCVDVVSELVTELTNGCEVSVHALGVTIGGHVEDYRTVTHADHLGWDQVPLAELLEAATNLPTVVENDIVAHTEATHWFGEGVGTDTFALFTLGAGIGYGLITHGQVVTSSEAGYSLVSHFPLASERLTHIEAELRGSTTGAHSTERLFRSGCGHLACATSMLTLGEIEARASRTLGRPVTFTQLLGLASSGDPTAQLLIEASGYALGTLFASIANLTMPQRIVVGGEAVELTNVAATAVAQGLHDNRDSRTSDPELRLQDPDLALWTRGAAVVAMHNTLVGR